MITCKQAVDYISKKEEGELSASQRLQLWRHLAYCSLCRTFSKQNALLRKFFSKNHEEKLSEGANKGAILKALQEADE